MLIWTIMGGAVAGSMGALLGLGGGVFLVPFLNLALGLPIRTASAISLVTVIATSSVTSASRTQLAKVNLRLGMVLEIFTTIGGLAGVLFVNSFSDRAIQRTFGITLVLVSIVMLSRLDRRNVILDPNADVGLLGGRYDDLECGRTVSYRVRRGPVACVASMFAGFVSNLGIGGGVLKVPVLNAWCGVPMRVAAATSALMIGATAVVGSVNYLVRGDIEMHLAAGAVLGVLAGSRAGFALAPRLPIKSLKLAMATIMIVVASMYFFRSRL